MAIWLRRFAPLVVAVGAFVLYLASILLEWSLPAWAVPAGLVATLGLIAILAPRPRRIRRSAPELYASDPYSDIELGRSAPTHPSIETRPTAQYGPPLPDDPLRLPPRP
ncbi:hypothetical protein KZX37_01575 [Microbacterium sp. EYE_5]|uniref:hypothetical protein n=1 Tax=unclassified Microbacterium TaxID=2609290 RepID=UPI00200409F3|nr:MULTISPECIES: hypothetical protein [unclassified Microbacterium]MCK6079307.1 hypothetical protein [Microbacterium sp. EYE_382]MCK6084577.1 hypothetical protein [Microbacterium sp. EYE_384]MCK6123194.1 hypothetical protein [Microbacterium sp. EYE_80]MCK6125341.1 hypothetical protein [Microbacterium sp. EYE_79]MCK6140261.1 hypothetical protein [Microbacterium sp. EYE_39]